MYFSTCTESNLTKYRASDLWGNLICEYFCWMLGDPRFFFGTSLPFLVLSTILKNKKNLYVGSFNYFSYTIKIGSNWYMDTGVRDLEVACFKANSTWINDIGSKDLSNRPIYAVLRRLERVFRCTRMPNLHTPQLRCTRQLNELKSEREEKKRWIL